MLSINSYIKQPPAFLKPDILPWQLCNKSAEIISALLINLPDYYKIDNGVAIHKTTKIEPNTVIKAPCIISEDCFIAAFSYLRGGVWLGANVIIGPGTEVKSSFICNDSKLAHLNFVGDSLIGSRVNIEAGTVLANYRNERSDKQIYCTMDKKIIATSTDKFGSLVGDDCKIGANAVLAPGTILPYKTVVKRLELIDQI